MKKGFQNQECVTPIEALKMMTTWGANAEFQETKKGKIIPGYVTGVSAKYQRLIAKEIKKARNIALLPYHVDPRNL